MFSRRIEMTKLTDSLVFMNVNSCSEIILLALS